MTIGDNFAQAKVTFEKERGEPAHLKINLADAARDDIAALAKILNWQGGKPGLPNLEIDLSPDADGAAKLIGALEHRGFNVEIDKENQTLDISKTVKLGDSKSPGEHIRRAQVVFDPEFGPVVEIGKGHYFHSDGLNLREKAFLIKKAFDKT